MAPQNVAQPASFPAAPALVTAEQGVGQKAAEAEQPPAAPAGEQVQPPPPPPQTDASMQRGDPMSPAVQSEAATAAAAAAPEPAAAAPPDSDKLYSLKAVQAGSKWQLACPDCGKVFTAKESGSKAEANCRYHIRSLLLFMNNLGLCLMFAAPDAARTS